MRSGREGNADEEGGGGGGGGGGEGGLNERRQGGRREVFYGMGSRVISKEQGNGR